MYKFIFVVLLATVLAFPQRRMERMKRLEQLEQVKLMEVLELNEETTLKFFRKRKEFHEKRIMSVSRLDSLYKVIEDALNKNSKDLSKILDEYTKEEKNMHSLRNDYLSALKKMLSPEQYAKVILFDRRFRDEIRGLMMQRGPRVVGDKNR